MDPSEACRQDKAFESLDQEGRDRIRKRLELLRLDLDEERTRPRFQGTKDDVHPKQAAVLVPLCCVDGEPSLLFTRRSATLARHAGEVCFPGGMVDEIDVSHLDTALRECQEELGVELQVDILGRYHDFPARGGILVSTFVGFLGDIRVHDIQERANKEEVEEVFTVSIRELLDVSMQSTFNHPKGYLLPVFNSHHPKNRIWGLTGMITHAVLYQVIALEESAKPMAEILDQFLGSAL